MTAVYDRIGVGYGRRRRADPRIQARVQKALGEAESVANVGAGTGSYEPVDRPVIAIEPSLTMIRQRPAGSAPAIRASADAIPLRARSVDAAMALLTIHHWPDRPRGLRELRRIARRRVVILTHEHLDGFWLGDYFPGIRALDRDAFPTRDELALALGAIEVESLPIPHDCQDGFLGAYWRRPAAYLDPGVRSAISTFSKLPAAEVDGGLARLAADLESGAWSRRHGDLLARETIDFGYRIVVAELPS